MSASLRSAVLLPSAQRIASAADGSPAAPPSTTTSASEREWVLPERCLQDVQTRARAGPCLLVCMGRAPSMAPERQDMTSMVDRLLRLLATADASQYGEESVSQCEHALQCALLAEQAGASGSVIAAALLHDIG